MLGCVSIVTITGSLAVKDNARGIGGGSVCFQLWSMALIKGFCL